MNDQLSKKLDPQEVDSLGQNPTRNAGSAGNSLHDDLHKFKGLDLEAQFLKNLIISRIYTTSLCSNTLQYIHDVDDEFGDRTGSCREYIKSRRDPSFEIITWIDGHIKTDAVV